ncbi:MAG: F0F1 ATP synthase subunit B [Thermoanaerobacteraceae bacterium]
MKEGKTLGFFNIWTVFFTILNLLVLYYILKRLLFKPVTDFLEARENKIKASLQDADSQKKQAYELKEKYEGILKNADDEGKAIIERAQKFADEKANKIVEQANKEAAAIMDRAKEEAELEKIKAMHDLRVDISRLVIDAASRVIEKNIEIDDQKVVDEVIKEAGATWQD